MWGKVFEFNLESAESFQDQVHYNSQPQGLSMTAVNSRLNDDYLVTMI